MKKFVTILSVLTLAFACAPVGVYAADSAEATTIEPTTDDSDINENPSTIPGGNSSPESPQTGSSYAPFILLITAAGATLVAKKKLS